MWLRGWEGNEPDFSTGVARFLAATVCVYMFDLPSNERHCDRAVEGEKDRRGIDRLPFIGFRPAELVLSIVRQDSLVNRLVVGGRIPVYLDTY